MPQYINNLNKDKIYVVYYDYKKKIWKFVKCDDKKKEDKIDFNISFK